MTIVEHLFGSVSSGQCTWNSSSVSQVQIPGRATILLGSNLGQVVYTHCLPSFSVSDLVAIDSYKHRISYNNDKPNTAQFNLFIKNITDSTYSAAPTSVPFYQCTRNKRSRSLDAQCVKSRANLRRIHATS